MSSFNINGPSNNQPLVQSSQNLGRDGGGGGNTGYMNMRNKKGGNDNQKDDDNSVFLEEQAEDSFVKQGEIKDKKPKKKFLGAISKFIKGKTLENESEKDSFVKQEDTQISEDELREEEYEEYKPYQIPLNKPKDILDDNEYEIAEDDDYYGGIDV